MKLSLKEAIRDGGGNPRWWRQLQKIIRGGGGIFGGLFVRTTWQRVMAVLLKIIYKYII